MSILIFSMLLDLKIEKIGISDVELLAKIAVKAYKDHYLHLWHDNGAWYIDKSFSIKQLESELANENYAFYLAIYQNEAVGFLKICQNKSLSGFDDEGFEIERIYLTAATTGKKIGQNLMKFAIKEAKLLNKKYVWLKAMDTSLNAIKFYHNLGFVQCGTSRLDFETMKEEVRGMVTLKLDL